MKVSIQIVTWNSRKFLPECLESIFNQTYKDYSVLIIDNASNDDTIEFVKENYPAVAILRNNKNLGFAAAHNQGIRLFESSPYLLVVNPDVILEKDWLEKILSVVEKDKKIGAIGGKLLKIYTSEPEINEKVKTKIIDSTGLQVLRSRRVIDRGEGELDQGQYDKKEEVFGLSAACALYSRTALEDIKIPTNYKSNANIQIYKNSSIRNKFVIGRKASGVNGEYFDEDFFSYKEDVDLSYRLRWRGWKLFYTPEAVAYHYRQVPGGKKKILDIIKKRRERSALVRYLSYRNHIFLLTKNESFINFLKDLPWILFYELGKFLYFLLFEQRTLRVIPNFFAKLPRMLKKRNWVIKNRKINSREIRKWFS